jgi:hypothetical protein
MGRRHDSQPENRGKKGQRGWGRRKEGGGGGPGRKAEEPEIEQPGGSCVDGRSVDEVASPVGEPLQDGARRPAYQLVNGDATQVTRKARFGQTEARYREAQ